MQTRFFATGLQNAFLFSWLLKCNDMTDGKIFDKSIDIWRDDKKKIGRKTPPQ